MHCAKVQAAISAGLDGEATGLDAGELAAHLEACEPCIAWRERAHRLTRLLRLQEAPRLVVPDGLLTALADVAPTRRRRPSGATLARAGLAAAGLLLVLVALPGFFLGHDQAAPAGVARELGALEAAAGIGLLAAAARPGSAGGLRVLVGAAAALFAVTALVDVAAGGALTNEAPSLLLVAGWLLLELLVRRARRQAPGASSAGP